MDLNYAYALSGFVVGFLVGMTGVGGGSLMTPILILVFRTHPQAAVGTDLLFAAATKFTGTLVRGRQRTVDWPVVGLLALGSLPATALTLLALHSFGSPPARVGHFMTCVIGGALLLTAPSVLFRDRLQRFAQSRTTDDNPRSANGLTVALGVVLGVLVTVSSVGAGAIGLAAMILLYPGRPFTRLVGADIAHAVPLTLLAGCGHWLFGSVNVQLLTALLIGSLPGVVLGSLAIGAIPARLQQIVLSSTLFLIGLKLLLS